MLLFGTPAVINRHEMPIVVAQLKIGFVKYLIFLNVSKHFKRTGALVKIIVVGKQVGEIVFKAFPRFVGQIKNIQIVCIKGAAVQPCAFDDIRNRDLLDLARLKQLDKGFFQLFLRVSAALVVFLFITSP